MIDIDQIGAPVFVAAHRMDGVFVYERMNAAVERVTGLSHATLIGRSPEDLFAPAVAAMINVNYRTCVTRGEVVEFESTMALPIGERVTRTTLTPLIVPAADGAITRVLGTIFDVTEQHRLREDLRLANARLAVAVDALGGAPWYYDAGQKTVEITSAFDRLLGADTPQTRTLDFAAWQDLIHPDDREDTSFADILAGRQEKGAATFRMQSQDGETRWFLCRRQAVTEDDRLAGIAGIIVDITQQKGREEALSLQATSDSLTGLSNRRRFEEVLAGEHARADLYGQALSLLMIDVDHFKRYNDGYGHLAGDLVLKAVAGCIGTVVGRVGGMAARYGGEEFVAVLPGQSTAEAADVAEAILLSVADLMEPHRASASGFLSVSIGVAGHAGGRGHVCEELVALADSALYRAKSDGRNCYRVRVATRLHLAPAASSAA